MLPLSATGLAVDADGQRFELAGRAERLLPGDATSPMSAGTPCVTPDRRARGGEVALADRPLRRRAAAPLRPGRGGRRSRSGAPARPPARSPTSSARSLARRRAAHVRRAAHPRRQLVLLPAPQARRLGRVPGQQRGDLLLPHRPGRRDAARPTASGCTASTRATAPIDETVEVRDGDVFLIPRGYHGPCVAAPGYTMYYLNVLAGPTPGARWPSATTPPTTGCGTRGRGCRPTPAAR